MSAQIQSLSSLTYPLAAIFLFMTIMMVLREIMVRYCEVGSMTASIAASSGTARTLVVIPSVAQYISDITFFINCFILETL
jgi:hypothetical protein